MGFTASSIYRVKECPPSAVLPAVNGTTDAARKGTVKHKYVRARLSGESQEMALSLVPDDCKDACRNIVLSDLTSGLDNIRTELAYAYNVETEEIVGLGSNLDRNYPYKYTILPWICGTCDLDGTRAIDGMPVVGDYKFGLHPVDPCRENTQIMYFARIRQLTTNAPAIEGRILYGRESGRVIPDSFTFSAFDLDTFADELKSVVARVLKAEEEYAKHQTLTVYTGDHCHFCGSMPNCPAYTALARSLASPSELEGTAGKIASLTRDQAGSAYVKYKQIKRILDQVKDALDMRVRLETSLPTTTGKEARIISYPRKSLSNDAAVAMMKKLGATEEDIDSCFKTKLVENVRECKSNG